MANNRLVSCKPCGIGHRSLCSFNLHDCQVSTSDFPIWCFDCHRYNQLIPINPDSESLKIGSVKSLADPINNEPEGFAEIVSLWKDEHSRRKTEHPVNSVFEENDFDLISFFPNGEADQNSSDNHEVNESFSQPNQIKTESESRETDRQSEERDSKTENLEDFYVCTDCDPMLLLENTDRLSDHFADYPDHFNINPICFYNQFSLKIRDIGKSSPQFTSLPN